MRGARLLAVPSAFTAATGRDHWEVLLRARAIENQAFVLAPNQVGEAPPALRLLRALGDRRPLGQRCSPSRPTRSASSPPTSTSPPRSGSASRCPRSPTAGPRPTPGRSWRRRTPDGLQSARRSTSAARSSTRRSASSPARASTRPASPTSPTRPGSPTGSSTTTSTPRTRCSTSSSPSAGRCCWPRSRRPTAPAQAPRDKLASGRRLHRRLLPPRPRADEGDHRRGHPGRQLLRPHPPAARSAAPTTRSRRSSPTGRRRAPSARDIDADLRLDVLLRRDRAAALGLDLRGDPGLRRGLRRRQRNLSWRRSATASSRDR